MQQGGGVKEAFGTTVVLRLYVSLFIAGDTDRCDLFDDTAPPETLLALMLWTEWTNSEIERVRDLSKAKMIHGNLLKTLSRWKDKKFVGKVMKRLEEMGVKDFNPEDFLLRLTSQSAHFYLNHPAARSEGGLPGIKLLEKEIIPIEREDYGASYLLADLKIQMGKPREAVRIIKPALEDAVSKNFQYNTSRLCIMLAKALIAGGSGPLFSKAQVVSILKDARRALKGCKFYLPKGKYEMYNVSLIGLESQMGISSGDDDSNDYRFVCGAANEVEPTYLAVRFILVF